MALAFVGRRYRLHQHHSVGRHLSEAAGWVSRQWGHIRTGQSATVDDDHFLISGDIQVSQFNLRLLLKLKSLLSYTISAFLKNTAVTR